jgi:hypothetical protein
MATSWRWRWVVYGVNLCAGSALTVLSVVSCSGGERPKAEVDPNGGTDAGTTSSGATGKALTFSGFDNDGIKFGDNGLINCGGQAPPKEITMRNPTSGIINFSAKLIAGADLYKINPESGGVQPGRDATITITPNPVPQESEVTPDLYAGTLEITNDIQKQVNDPPTNVRLHLTARGTIITSTAKEEMDFGDVRIGKPISQLFSLTNLGNVGTTANFTLGSQVFTIDQAQSVVGQLDAAKALSKQVTLNPTANVAYTDAIAISYTGGAAHCKKPPESLKLKGKGATSVAASPGTLNFGSVLCGTAAPFQIITIDSSVACKMVPQLGKGALSFFTLADNAGGAIALGVEIDLAANTPYIMRVVPKTIGRGVETTNNSAGDELTITTNAAQDTPHKIALTMTPSGAILGFTPTSLMVSSNMAGAAMTQPFTINNTGNLAANYTITVDPPTSFSANLGTGVAAIGATNGVATLIIPAAGQATGTLSITSPSTLCKDLPGAITLSATKSN